MLSTKLKEAAGNSADATLYVDDVFSTWLYTGNGSTQTITNGIDLAGKGGLVWIKHREDASGHRLFDTYRGTLKSLMSNDSLVQETTADSLTSFNSNGFSLGSSVQVNNGGNITSWTFRKAAKFFDVVTYTGTGSARTITHSLGVAPGMVIVKRTDTTGNWQVYHRSLTSAAYSIRLNLTNAQASAPTVWNSTAPTSSVFSVGTDATVNASGGTYVAYLYAHDTSSTGIIQCGSLTTGSTGTGSATLGWEPQYIMVKRINGANNWTIYDSMRGWNVSGQDNYLLANQSLQEGLYEAGYPTATGFVYVDGGVSGETYIYMAIRIPNKPPTSGTQVFSPLTYTGNGAGRTITGVGFPVDATIIDARNSAYGSIGTIGDRLRNTYMSETSSNATESKLGISNFDNMSGFNLSAGLQLNASPYSFISWNFARAPGFFDEVCYTGTGSATTQAHNLGVAPEMMIIKSRSNTGSWWVYDNYLSSPTTKYLRLNEAVPAGAGGGDLWNSTAPTNSVFSVGIAETNYSGYTYVAYLFATLAGISKVGSYTGNGTGQAIACGFSAGARFVLIKRTNSTGDWYTFDSARGLTSTSSPYSLLNSTAAETTGNNGVYASTGGFTLGSTASTTTNINGASYIYLSVA